MSCQRDALHELNAYLRIDQLKVEDGLRVPRILGFVQGEDCSSYMGLLLSYIDCDSRTLEGAVRADTPKHLRQRWADQVSSTLKHLHEAGIVWGDAKAANVLVNTNMDAWIMDFGGGFTEGWVEREKAGTVEGDIQGLAKIVDYIFAKTKHPHILLTLVPSSFKVL
jgi:serine/threonine protein kinase